jgi:hypothetical protein
MRRGLGEWGVCGVCLRVCVCGVGSSVFWGVFCGVWGAECLCVCVWRGVVCV